MENSRTNASDAHTNQHGYNQSETVSQEDAQRVDPVITARAIEVKWQKRWAETRSFESDPEPGREKKYITAAFPYPNSPQHIGHARTYTTADIHARYLRLKGYNVLFPMGFHVTGTPILAMAKRIAAKDEEVLGVFERIYGISRERAATLSEPKALVTHFSEEIEQGMKEMGFSIDWRRKFYSYDEKFNRFIQWQFRKLKEAGYLKKGEYPIAWCPSDGNAVSAHDTRGDIDPELEDVTVIRFEVAKGESLIVTTYRPETIYGVTNIWVNPNVEYVKTKLDGKTVILSKDAAQALHLQLKLESLEPITIEKLLKMKAKNPVTKKKVPLFPASFVKAGVGTGVVMSVPAHAPLDFLALRDMGKTEGEDAIEIPQVVATKGYGSMPAKEVVERLGVKDQNDPKSVEATKELYKKEAHEGTMITGEFTGQKSVIAKDKIAAAMKKDGDALAIVTLSNGPIQCRCGAGVVVNIIKDQWFIDYGIPTWKIKAKECLAQMNIIPEKSRAEYSYTIDWLMTRPCTRAAGLGTRFPFDPSKMIEALSDSTLYMAYYTIAHMLDSIDNTLIDDTFFDYVFLGRGTGNGKPVEMKGSFDYWYPVDSRHSAGDLIRNHLTLYMFIHSGLLEEKHWPKQIAANGFVTMDGTKMSKSMGNIMPLRKAIQEYSADVIRFAVIAGAELSSDTDFSRSVADGVGGRLEFIRKLVTESAKGDMPIMSRMDYWMLSRLNRRIARAEKFYETMCMRELALEIFYDVTSDLQWYTKRTKRHNLKDFFKTWAILISPMMPHVAEEVWETLGDPKNKTTCRKEDFASFAEFPKSDPTLIDEQIEQGEDLIKSVGEDVERISGLIGKKPAKVTLIVAATWKRKLYEIAKSAEPKTFETILKTASAQGLPMKDAPNVVKGIMKNIHSLQQVMTQNSELEALKDAQDFLGSEFGGCQFVVLKEEESAHPKAKISSPGKPGIIIE